MTALSDPAGARDRLRAARASLDASTAELARLERRASQLAALRAEPIDRARLARLDAVFMPERMAAQARHAVSRAGIVEAPVPHAIVSSILPDDAYEAIVDAVPPPLFFDDPGTNRLELALPPALAPVAAVVAWRFLTALVVDELGPALIARFADPLRRHLQRFRPSVDPASVRLTASQGRLLWRQPGFEPRPRRRHPWHFLTTVIPLCQQGAAGMYGSVVCGDGEGGDARTVPFGANMALVVLDPDGAHAYAGIPRQVAPDTVCCAYEFPIGPDGESRRRLA